MTSEIFNKKKFLLLHGTESRGSGHKFDGEVRTARWCDPSPRDILECKVKWALGSITMNKASGGDGISFELFQILKDDAVKVLHLICQQIWKTQQWSQDWKGSVFILIPKKGNAKEYSNYYSIMLLSHASKVVVQILQASLQQYVNQKLPDV